MSVLRFGYIKFLTSFSIYSNDCTHHQTLSDDMKSKQYKKENKRQAK